MGKWVLATLLASSSISAATNQKISNFWSIDVGAYVNNIKERLSAPTDYGSRVSTLAGYLRFRRGWHIGKNYTFEPSFGTMVPYRKSADGAARTLISNIDLDIGIPLWNFLRFRTGPGIEWGMIQSTAETILLNNGGGTSSFYMPDRTTHYFLITTQAGFEIHFSRRFTLCTQLIVSNLLSSERRRYNAAVTLGIRL